MDYGIFSWGVYYGYGLAFVFGIYITKADVLGYGWRAPYVLAALPGYRIQMRKNKAAGMDEPMSAPLLDHFSHHQ